MTGENGLARKMARYEPRTHPGALGFHTDAMEAFLQAQNDFNDSISEAAGYIEEIQNIISSPEAKYNPVLRPFMDTLCVKLVGRPCGDVAQSAACMRLEEVD